jgi:uncharacterized protein (TIGR02284 family)
MAENIPGRREPGAGGDEESARPRAHRAGVQPEGESRLSTSTSINPALEADYWRTNYQHRPYVEPGATFDDYAPAYEYGWEAYTAHASYGRSFDQAEPELRQRWGTRNSKLSWDKAKHAVQDAWNRVSGGGKDKDTALPMLKHLYQTCMDGVKGFRDAAEKVAPGTSLLFQQLADERGQMAAELQQEIEHFGGGPARAQDVAGEGDTLGAVHRGWINLKAALGGGEKAILEECERGEDAAVKAYQDALNGRPPGELEVILSRQYSRIKNAHDKVKELRDTAA